MSTNAAFFEAAAILLREGLEAILVLAALAAYLTRADAKNRLKMRWLGAAAALVVSVATAWVFEHFYNDAHNYIFEGVTIFVTAMFLFYVSGWLLLRQDPRVWKNYLKKQTDRALSANSAWLVAALNLGNERDLRSRDRGWAGQQASRSAS
jgi:high-affinity iron transporter